MPKTCVFLDISAWSIVLNWPFFQGFQPQLLQCVLGGHTKHQFFPRFMRARETSVFTVFPEGRAKHRTDRVNSGWAKVGGPRHSRVGWSP